ncbi:MAG TPA: hypothetical protein VET89_02030 [Stellaceae bacterium]|jgi:hypothetical protein|nr:hypothetical protein [Stellaceae bacterium]
MLHITAPTTAEALSYSVLASLAIEAIIAILLAVRGDWLGVVLVLVLAAILYWFVCRQLVAVISAGFSAGASGTLLFLCALIEFLNGYPYYGLLFLIAAVILAFIVILLQQGAAPGELRVGGIVAVGPSGAAAHLRMLQELRDAGLLTQDELIAKRALLDL